MSRRWDNRWQPRDGPIGLTEGHERLAFGATGDDFSVAECDGTGGVTVWKAGAFVFVPELLLQQQGAVLSRTAFDAASDARGEDADGANERGRIRSVAQLGRIGSKALGEVDCSQIVSPVATSAAMVVSPPGPLYIV